MQLFLHYILFGENLLVKLKYLYIQYAWISIMKLSCKIVKEFETEI